MKPAKRAALERRGWVVGGTDELLGLSNEESALVELAIDLARHLRELRTERGVSQVELAQRIGSSQSRVAKMEAGDPSVSIDLLLRGIFALGERRRELARFLARAA